MFNPGVLLAVGILWAASLGTAYVSGHRNATNAAKAQQAKAQAELIEAYNKNAAIDAKAAQDAAWEQQKTRVEYRERVNTVEKIIRQNPSECRVSDDVFGLLNAAIDSANNAGTSKPPRVPTATEASFKPQ